MGIAALTSIIEPLKNNQKNVYVAIGAKDDASLIFVDRLIELIPNTLCTTDDGSVGKKCYVTDTIEDILKEKEIDLILTCGPEVMMKGALSVDAREQYHNAAYQEYELRAVEEEPEVRRGAVYLPRIRTSHTEDEERDWVESDPSTYSVYKVGQGAGYDNG